MRETHWARPVASSDSGAASGCSARRFEGARDTRAAACHARARAAPTLLTLRREGHAVERADSPTLAVTERAISTRSPGWVRVAQELERERGDAGLRRPARSGSARGYRPRAPRTSASPRRGSVPRTVEGQISRAVEPAEHRLRPRVVAGRGERDVAAEEAEQLLQVVAAELDVVRRAAQPLAIERQIELLGHALGGRRDELHQAHRVGGRDHVGAEARLLAHDAPDQRLAQALDWRWRHAPRARAGAGRRSPTARAWKETARS